MSEKPAPQKGPTTPYSRACAKRVRALIDKSQFAATFKRDPEATVTDLITDLLHLTRTDATMMADVDDILRMAEGSFTDEADPEQDPREFAVRDGNLQSLSGHIICGRLDQLRATCHLSGFRFEADGKIVEEEMGASDVDWNSQMPVVDKDGKLFCDERGMGYSEAELVWISNGLPKRVPHPEPEELVAFLEARPVLANILRNKLTVKIRGGQTRNSTIAEVVFALRNAKSIKMFRTAYRVLKAAIWSWKSLHTQA